MNILIPTDFCELGGFAYDLARKILKVVPESNIHFVHVVDIPEDESYEGKDFTSWKEEAQLKMNQWLEKYPAEGHVYMGHMTDQILQAQADLNINLMVLGNAAREGLKEIFSTNETTILARKGNAPVLSLMCDRSDMHVEKFLFLHNFLEDIKADVSMMKVLSKVCGAEIHFLQVDKDHKRKDEVMAAMAQFAKDHDLEVAQKHICSKSDVEKGLVEFIQEKHFDVIVQGTFVNHNLVQKVMGSISESILNHVHKPILTFKMEGK